MEYFPNSTTKTLLRSPHRGQTSLVWLSMLWVNTTPFNAKWLQPQHIARSRLRLAADPNVGLPDVRGKNGAWAFVRNAARQQGSEIQDGLTVDQQRQPQKYRC